MTKAVELFIQHHWKGETSFRSFQVHLNKLLLDFAHPALHLVGGGKGGFDALLFVELGMERFNLRLEVPDFINCLMQLGNAIGDVLGKDELFLHCFFLAFGARITHQMQQGCLRFSVRR